ncbi:lipopolysaccharide biosynthesis protein [Thalassovita aquimarina]|uniref:lipopolysaccharide biosynthesis protein n=1 Tax=Thalassovita aquimarina TaxID=2785917 RepID=UPI001BAE9352
MSETDAMAGGRKLTETTIAGIGWTSMAVGARALLQMIAIIFLARLLSPEQFGLYAAAMVVGSFCAIFSELGVSPAIVQRPALEPRHIRTGFTLSVAVGLFVGLIAFLLADTIAGFFQMPALAGVVRVMAIGFPLRGIATVAEALALRDFRFRWLALVEAGAFGIGFIVVAPVLSLLDFGVHALVGAYLTQNAVRTVVLLACQPHEKRPMLERRAIGELIYFGTGFTIAKFCNYFATQADNLVVGRWLGPAALGLYGHAYHLMAAPAILVGQALDRVMFPTMASVQHQRERLARAYRSGVYVCATVMFPTGVVVAILAPEIVLILLGPAWIGAAVPLRLLALGMLFRTSSKISDSIVRATGAVYARAWRQGLFAVAVLLGALIGQNWGLIGVATGVFCALAFNFLMMAHLSLRLTSMSWRTFGQAHLPGLLFAAILGGGSLVAATGLRDAGAATGAVVAGTVLLAALLVPLLVWTRPRFFLGPDRVQLLRALANVGPMRMRRGVALLQRRISG